MLNAFQPSIAPSRKRCALMHFLVNHRQYFNAEAEWKYYLIEIPIAYSPPALRQIMNLAFLIFYHSSPREHYTKKCENK